MANISLSETLEQLLSAPHSPEINSFAEWKANFCDITDDHQVPWHHAINAGFQANCVGYAFAAGYQAALRSLVPTLPTNQLSALCVTEESGNHPKSITTTLSTAAVPFELNGAKKFITGGPQADTLLVAAKTNEFVDDRPVIKLIKVDSNAKGVTINSMPPLPFVPEIDHAAVTFEQVKFTGDAILPGDGYADYVKPFRTIEDIYVSLALSSYLLKICLTTQAPQETTEETLSIIASHASLAQQSATNYALHLLLAGARKQFEHLIPSLEIHWQATDLTSFQCWQRDKALLNIAGTARIKRTETAWAKLLSES